MEMYQLGCAIGAGVATGAALACYSRQLFSLVVIFGTVALVLFCIGMPNHI